MNNFEPGDRIGDKAGNTYLILDRRTMAGGRAKPELQLRRERDNAERWIDEEIVNSFSFMV